MVNTIAIDLGGTIIKIGLLKNCKLADRREVPAQSALGLKSQLPVIENTIDNILAENSLLKSDISGIGFSFAGLVDSMQNKIISTNQKYADGPAIDLPAWAKATWGWPLFMENDARMALLGEWQHGAGQGIKDLLMVTIGTGIGSAVLINGQLLKGKHFQAGNLGGHFTINYNGSKCTCGNIGCMEAEASTWNLPMLARQHPAFNTSLLSTEKLIDFKTLFDYVAQKDPVAMDLIGHCLAVWSAGIITMIHAFDPEMVILSGGILKSASVIIPAIQEKVDQLAWTPWGKVKIVEACYPDSSALYGADYLVQKSLKPELFNIY